MYTRCAIFLTVLSLAAATEVQQCPGKSYENLSNVVQVSPCKKVPCKLKKGTNEHITIEFTPEKDLADLRNRVTANVLGVPLPFPGVDGQSVCEKITTEGGEKAACPLKAGTKYTYTDSFPVLKLYPSLSTDVTWSLQHNNRDVICFKVPVRIV